MQLKLTLSANQHSTWFNWWIECYTLFVRIILIFRNELWSYSPNTLLRIEIFSSFLDHLIVGHVNNYYLALSLLLNSCPHFSNINSPRHNSAQSDCDSVTILLWLTARDLFIVLFHLFKPLLWYAVTLNTVSTCR